MSTRYEQLSDNRRMDRDVALVTRAQEGELGAFEELIVRHSSRIYRTIMAIIKNAEDTQDAMQDTFLNAFLHIDDFQSRSSFSTWLTRIASNTALQRLRGQKRSESLRAAGMESELHSFPIRAWNATPEQLYSQAERRQLIKRSLKNVPNKYRTVLILCDLKQLSNKEAATVLGLGITALKARLFRARRMLRDALSPYFAVNAQKVDEDQ